MSLEEGSDLPVWFALRDLEQSFLSMLGLAPSVTDRQELWVDYEEHRQDLEGPIVAVRAALTAAFGGDDGGHDSVSYKCFSCLLIHYDEREVEKVAFDDRPEQTLFQTQYCEIYNGGEVFVENLEKAVRASSTPPLYLQILLFCLRSGFCGSYATLDDPERVAKVAEVSELVAAAGPAPPVDKARSPSVRAIGGIGFPFGYYLGAAAFLGCLWLLLGTGAHQKEEKVRRSVICPTDY